MSLILTLLAISLFFTVYVIVLYSLGIGLTPEAYAQIISDLATLLVVVLTIGLRLIDDELDRYEKTAKPRIISSQALLGRGGVKSEVKNFGLHKLPYRSRDLIKTTSSLAKYGRFFLTKLYPQKTLNKIIGISHGIDEFLALVKNFEPYSEKSIDRLRAYPTEISYNNA